MRLGSGAVGATLLRRRFLKIVGGAAVALGGGGLAPVTAAGTRRSLTPFVDPLPVPGVIEPGDTYNGVPRFHVAMRAFRKKLHRDLPPTPLWGYNGLYPGPTFDVRRDRPIAVRWTNELPARHLFPIDQTLHGDGPDQPDVPTFTGPCVQPPGSEQAAFKDTVKAFPGQVTRIIARFDLPSGTPAQRGDRFRYVFHCHILEHEDNEMMRPYDVVG